MTLSLAPLKKTVLMAFIVICTIVTGGPFLWVAALALRTTPEILNNPYGLPTRLHWDKFAKAWNSSSYDLYFWNSTLVVVVAVSIVMVFGAMSAHCLARYRFAGRRTVRFLLLSGLMLPPQMLILSLFQMMFHYGLYNSLAGLVLVYVAVQLPMTVYLLESFFAQIPEDLFDAARLDGYTDFETFWRITLPIGLPAIFTTVTLNFIMLWNEFLYAVVLLTDNSKRTLPLGIMHFMGGHQIDVGMVATGLIIAALPVVVLYALFSETMIKGMTAGAMR
jgi:multiple sugar transport system permease protein/raffinose/stachyose/melibiose transport system permease protein